MSRKQLIPRRGAARLVPVLAAALLLAGCATMPPPTDLMQRAESALQAARAAGAADHAPLELGFASKKLDKAQSAVRVEHYLVATRLARESQVNSNLARVKSALAAQRQANSELSAKNDRLRKNRLGDTAVGAGGGA